LEDKFLKSMSGADLSVCENAGAFLQSAMWGRFKARFGWKADTFAVEWVDSDLKPLLVLSRNVAPCVTMAYVPWGPELPAGLPQAGALRELARVLRRLLPRNVTFIRFDPPWFAADGAPQILPAPFVRASADIQPPDTVLVDLTPPHEDILAAMKPKWRYNIGLAQKRGVVVSRKDEQGIDAFYRLLAETAARDGIAVHSIDYYRALFEECHGGAEPSRLSLYAAEHEGDALAAIVVLCRGNQAAYLYGASANIKRNLMSPYALQWQAMRDAKALGCAQYDLFGIPPNDDPHHPMTGLYRFKTGFGGNIVRRPGSWDYPCNPALYALFSGAERLRKKIRDRRKRQS
jgi:lipid II:glycine glycyltransferase (peptidoglycan interpeptide bridge formation enzyme)